MKEKYLNFVHIFARITLVIIFVSIICEIFFETTSNYDYLILIILYLFSMLGSKKSSCMFMIVASILLIVESLVGFSSIFNAIFLILGVVAIYYSIRCLKIKD